MSMELQSMMENGFSIYYGELEKMSLVERYKLRRSLFHLNVDDELFLSLVNDFARKRHLAEEYDDGNNLAVVGRFCGTHIWSFRDNTFRTIYGTQWRLFKQDYEVLASIKDYNLDPDQFWYLLLFCKKYVDKLTTNLSIFRPSVDEELNTIVAAINGMAFNSSDWTTAYPKEMGKLEVTISGKKKCVITGHNTLHLLSELISNFQNKYHTEVEEFHLYSHFDKESEKEMRWEYLNGKECLSEEEKVELQTIEKDIVIGVDTDGLYNERSDYQKIALFKYFIIDYLNRAEPKKQNIDVYYDYKKGYATINNKLFLISKLIKYIYNYGIKWSGVDLKKLYNNRDCLKNNIKDYDIRTENDVERYLKSLTDKRHLKP